MDIQTILNVVQVIICILLIVAILLQQREGGLGTTFGGAAGGEGYRTRRGLEKFLTKATVFLGILLVVNTIAINTI